MCTLNCFSHVWLFSTLWTEAHQAPLCMGFSRQEYWSGLRCPPPGDLPYPGTEPMSLVWQMDSLTLAPQGNMFSLYIFFCNFSFALQYEHALHLNCKWLQLIHFSGIKYSVVWFFFLTFVIIEFFPVFCFDKQCFYKLFFFSICAQSICEEISLF